MSEALMKMIEENDCEAIVEDDSVNQGLIAEIAKALGFEIGD
jgi:hypothetical protein